MVVYKGEKCAQCGEALWSDHICKGMPARGIPGEPTEIEAKFDPLADLRKVLAQSEVDYDENIGG